MTGAAAAEQIAKSIRDMGYITAEPKGKLKPSFYKLRDGTIIGILAKINHLVEQNSSDFSVNANNLITTYVPRKNRHPDRYQQYNPSDVQSSILEEDMEIETLVEDFNVYSLSNGKTVSVKSVVVQVDKTKFYTTEGEPIYMINSIPTVKFKKATNAHT